MFKFVEQRITHYAVNFPILGEVKTSSKFNTLYRRERRDFNHLGET